jgi:preprotein translocase subunit SecF
MADFFRKYWFTLYMSVIVSLTMVVFFNVFDFKNNSTEHSLTLSVDKMQAEDIRIKLQGITYQPVEIEPVGENQYRIKLRCPPEKYDQISRWVFKKIENN